MSDSAATTATAPKKIKLNFKQSKDDTPAGSRAGSPTPAGGAAGRAAPAGGSRASSPDGAGRGKLKLPFSFLFLFLQLSYANPVPKLPGRTRPSTPRGSPSPPASTATVGSFPTANEIRATIPAAGISIGELIKLFKPRIGNEKAARTRFISIIKEVSDFSLEDKLVRPKAE